MTRYALRRWALALPALLVLTLAACGTKGYAPALGDATTTALTGSQPGSLTLTPFYATRVVAYYLGKPIPYVGATTPVELRQGSCAGAVIANLTQDMAAPASNLTATAAAAGGGADVAMAVDESAFVVIRARANDPNAAEVACGAPLSNRRQYFDLYTPGQGANGTQYGLTLIEPFIATRVQARLTEPATTALGWTLFPNPGCAGQALAHGEIAPSATRGDGVIFRAAPHSGWSLSLTAASAAAPSACQSVSG